MSNHSTLWYNSGFFLLLLLEVTDSSWGVLREKQVMCVHQVFPKLCSMRPFLLNFPLAPVFCSCPHFCTLLILWDLRLWEGLTSPGFEDAHPILCSRLRLACGPFWPWVCVCWGFCLRLLFQTPLDSSFPQLPPLLSLPSGPFGSCFQAQQKGATQGRMMYCRRHGTPWPQPWIALLGNLLVPRFK